MLLSGDLESFLGMDKLFCWSSGQNINISRVYALEKVSPALNRFKTSQTRSSICVFALQQQDFWRGGGNKCRSCDEKLTIC